MNHKVRTVSIINQSKGLILLLGLSAIFFSFVSPIQNSSLIAVAGSALVALTVYALILFVLRLISALIPISQKSRKSLALAATSVIVFLLLMQSIGQLSFRDGIAILPITVILYLYIGYLSQKRARVPKRIS
jgi:hypothetical protein